MDSNTNNLIITILIGLLLALLIHYLACPEPKITQFNNGNHSSQQENNQNNKNDNLIETFQNNTPEKQDQCIEFNEDDTTKKNESDKYNLDEDYLGDNSNFSNDEKMYHLIKTYNEDIILEKVKEDYRKINQLDKLEIRLREMKKVLEGFNNQKTLYNTNGVISKTN